MARDWGGITKGLRYAWGGTPLGQMVNWTQGLMGKEGVVPLLDIAAPVQKELPTRPSTGLEGRAAAQEQARSMQSILNQQLMGSTIPMINRQWGGAGRYASGQRLGAIERAMGQSQGVLGQQVGQNALQVYLAQLGAQEERDWRQAQLDWQGQQQSPWGGMGELLPYLLMAMG